ncbi:MAG: right-handed parallel beta-helix repeat-containing protein [Deltaproteobacteria bacterium]|nr:right-handed parallel beta-helix repeat-containing protein [Deltaproteobacteria bacterium]
MKARRCTAPTLVVAAIFLASCTASRRDVSLPVPPVARVVEERILYAPVTWSGDVRIVRPLVVTRTATLTLLPGTRVFFDVPEPATEQERQPWILVLGSMVAVGSEEQPISFSSVHPRRSELDDMIQLQKAKEAHFRFCRFERGPWALHIHETRVEVESSTFRDNYGGVRFQGDTVLLRGNRFEGNILGVRCLKASPLLEENTFLRNTTGVFFREGVQGAAVHQNNFENLEYEIKLGEGQTADVDASHNWWGETQKTSLSERIYDGSDAPGLGRVIVDAPLATPWGQAPRTK